MLTRRTFLKLSAGAGALAVLPGAQPLRMPLFAPICRPAVLRTVAGSLAAAEDPKYEVPLLIPPAMPKLGRIRRSDGGTADYYVIAVRQFEQQILPPGLPATTVWGYGARNQPSGTVAERHLNFRRPTVEIGEQTHDARALGERVGRQQRQLPAASAARGSDAALGEPARRRRDARHARDGWHGVPRRCPWCRTYTAHDAGG
ncbi:MAG: twin-arginine translocation signal domain-containing protein [Caldilineaceae bacterium]|nr:twin-arginine translocation signal domain-containing protein [Caldilineaceae bacterium]